MFEMSNDLVNQLWVEKYRPKKIDDVILHEDQKEFIKKCIEKGEIPHLAFFGPPGSGKTTLARIIVESLIKSDMDVLIMNGSDQTGIDNMRTNVVGFLKSPPYASKFKLVYIDEFDYTSQNAQSVLRNVMENYAENGRFIVTGNYQSKVLDPLISRFTLYEMERLSKDFVLNYVENILKSEKVEYDKNTVDLIVQNYIPDVRKIVSTLQKNTIDSKLKKIDISEIASGEKKIIGFILQICDDMNTPRKDATLNQNTLTIMELISKQEPDYRQIYEQLFFNEKLPLWAKIKVNQYQNTHQSCALPSAHFMAMVYDIIQAGMVYFSMFAKK